MGRYFPSEDTEGGKPGHKEEIIRITDDAIKKAKNKSLNKPAREHGNKSYRKKKKKGVDPFPGKKPVDSEALERHARGEGVDTTKVRTKFKAKEQARREERVEFANVQAARAEVLTAEEAGLLEGDEEQEFTGQIKQQQIRKAVDTETAAKSFDLKLAEFGPYTCSYTRNGRHLVLGGRRGHIAAFDWQTKALTCEISAGESVHAVQWLHTENLFAVAQKKWTYVYDNQGIEIHCVKKMDHVTQLEFLPYHMLLCGASDRGGLSWLDVSVGKMVTETWTKMGSLQVMCQNPATAVLVLGHSQGTVTMWTPNMKEPAAKMLVHGQPCRAVSVDRSGNYLATSSTDRTVKVWDLRTYQPVCQYSVGAGASQLQWSQRGLLATSFGNRVEVYKDPTKEAITHPYMKHEVARQVSSLRFCPYEDVLGVGHAGGFSSMLVPGAGEPNFDALEANPFQTVKQRREAEVKQLLDKVAPELISLDRDALAAVDVPTMQDKVEERNKKLFVKPSNIEFDPRAKMKGKGGSATRHHIRRTVIEQARKRGLKDDLEARVGRREGQEKKPAPVYKNVLDRFKSK